jgi:hypothetical protein
MTCPCLLFSLQDPSLWPAAVDEICRYHTASSYALRRVALEDVKLGGTTIKYVTNCVCMWVVYAIHCSTMAQLMSIQLYGNGALSD